MLSTSRVESFEEVAVSEEHTETENLEIYLYNKFGFTHDKVPYDRPYDFYRPEKYMVVSRHLALSTARPGEDTRITSAVADFVKYLEADNLSRIPGALWDLHTSNNNFLDVEHYNAGSKR